MPAEENKAIVLRAIEHWNDPASRAGYFNLYDDDVVIHGFPSGLPPGVAGLKQYYNTMWAAFSDTKVAIGDLVSEGDKLAARYTFTGTHAGDFLGVPPTHQQVSMSGMTILRMVDGKCVERWNARDSLGLMQQIGAIPTS